MTARQRNTLKWLAGVALIAAIFWFNREELYRALQQDFDVTSLIFAGCIYLAAIILTFFRWYLLVRPQELPFSQWDALRLGFIGMFFSVVLPGSVTGDLIKAGLLAKEQDRRLAAITTILVDRGIGLYGLLVLMSLMGVIFWPTAQATPTIQVFVMFVWVLTLVLTLFILVISFLPTHALRVARHARRLPAIGGLFGEGIETFHRYRKHYRYGLAALMLAVIGHVGFVMSFYFSARSTPEPTPPLRIHFLIIPVGMVAQAVPLTPGNLGVSEGVYQVLYKAVDPDLAVKGALASLAQRVVTWGVALIGLVLYIPLRRTVRQVLQQSEYQTEASHEQT